jgi:predicted outer membrane repeat protein
MKKRHSLSFFLVLLLVVCEIQSQTAVPGGNVSGTWTLAGSPYQVQGSVQILNGSTLTIQPGVTVEFQGTYKMIVSGCLLAIGTITDTIIFTATNTTNGWRGIDFPTTATTNDTTKISYCKIEYGIATGTTPDNMGGALYFNTFSKAIVSHSRIVNNSAISLGGAIYCYLSSPIFENNTITNNSVTSGDGGAAFIGGQCSPRFSNNIVSYNTSSSDGGAFSIANNYCTPTIDNNTITYNTGSWGGGIHVTASNCDPIISNNNISYNTATSVGGGIVCYFGVGNNCIISNNVISNNVGNSSGGGIWCNNSSKPTISYNKICNNSLSSASGTGGGISCTVGSHAKLNNNTIVNNSAFSGGGIYTSNCTLSVVNVTIANNSATNGGGMYCTSNSDGTLRNTILWGNTASGSGNQVYAFDDNSDPNFYFCDVEGSDVAFALNGGFFTGTYTSCLNFNPLFVSPSSGTGTSFNGLSSDWSLQATSPCIDAGDNTYSPYPATDLAGNPRVTVCRIDQGAYEYQNGIPFAVTQTHNDVTCFNACNGSATVNPSGGSGPYNYSWLPGGQTSQTVSNLCNGTYTVQVGETGGCSTTVNITITQPSSATTSTVDICMVTVDSMSVNNVIFWDKTNVPLADTFLIYRDTANNNYALIGKVPYDSLSEFADTVRTLYAANGDPNVSSWRYKIAVYDTCGNIGAMSPYHQTMFFQNSSGNFSWNHYEIEGQSTPVPVLSNYRFKRDDNATGVWNTIQTLSASSTAYTDPNYATYTATADWRVETQWTVNCNSTFKLGNGVMASITKSRSNIQNNRVNLGIHENYSVDFSVYPNPAKDQITIQLNSFAKNTCVEICDVTGRTIKKEKIIAGENRITVSTAELCSGIYLVRLNVEGGNNVRKLVIEK